MTRRRLAGVGIALAVMSVSAASPQRIERIADVPAPMAVLPVAVHGRVVRDGDAFVRQWPGSYFEAGFAGPAVVFRIGSGEVALHLSVDGVAVETLVKPAPGLYRIDGLARGRHRLRIEVASESQAGPTRIGPFYAAQAAAPPAPRTRRIEFIGDSHTVGYGVTSATRDCSEDGVWRTTDTSQGFGAQLARRYRADYQVNAISGRGVVRNYDGFAADPLPDAYPYALFDHRTPAAAVDWHPQVIVIALGTNDFTTPLHAGERWPDRAALHADYEARYVRFVQDLRRRAPQALIVLWATDMAQGEIEAEVAKVAARLRAAGERRIAYVPVDGLAFAGCHNHPSLADQTVIATRIAAAIDAQPQVWTAPALRRSAPRS
ncbi:SGNH/GDSL hydrolase family protein [Sphingomonas sp. RIT328]|uniref:SGNH/GDSL hydrolase family protein n=1 Tax=Sphingomonas sp. RIT328 TaxID=1470591 RepID=UPI00044C0D3D|nr:SGNH/GDSL hydrolase family protein [Sphingomonas sp. RIT328]EZP56120.1 Endoglucanase E precursor [Sphingomonas sp. RIT328]